MMATMIALAAAGSITTPTEVPLVDLDHDAFVTMNLVIGNEGKLASCQVIETDAPEAFQKAACGAMLERARFNDKGQSASAGAEKKMTMRFTAGRHPLDQTNQWDAYLKILPNATSAPAATH